MSENRNLKPPFPIQNRQPFEDDPLRKSPVKDQRRIKTLYPFRPEGEPVWHRVTGSSFSAALPVESKGPIRAREVRRQKGRQMPG